MKTGERIRFERRDETLKTFAAKLGISVSYLADLEHNRRRLTLELARKLDGDTSYHFRACVLLDMGWFADEVTGVQDHCHQIEENRRRLAEVFSEVFGE